MEPIIFPYGLNHVTYYKSDKVVPDDLQLYYWHNSADQYKPVGTLSEIKNTPSNLGTTNIDVNLDGIPTRLGTVDNTVLFYNSNPNVPIKHNRSNILDENQYEQVEPIPLTVVREREQERARMERARMERARMERAQAQTSNKFPSNDIPNINSVNRLTCPICLERTKNLVFNCGPAICDVCDSNLTKRECPICKTSISNQTPLYIGGYSNNDYKIKYLKYKHKYLELKKLSI